MQDFHCASCGHKVYFENVACVNCGAVLGFDPDALTLTALDGNGGGALHFCANAYYAACNWLTRDARPGALCRACGINRTIPDLADEANLAAWRDLELAKKRLIYSLLRFHLPFSPQELLQGLTFDFKQDAMTGHADGRITIDIAEADAVSRERQRQAFGEAYRSLLGHLRHESGHFYWMLLVEEAGTLEPFRALFGDEREDYGEALARHHDEGPRPDWREAHVSAYAGVHPWEDWAETWAHYLHMVDAVDTAQATGMEPRAADFTAGMLWPFAPDDPYREESFGALMERWTPLAGALNSLARSLGHQDFYPFVIPAPARAKLEFVHDAIRGFVRA